MTTIWWNSIMTSHRASISSSGQMLSPAHTMDGTGQVPIIPGIHGIPIILGDMAGMTPGILLVGIVLSTTLVTSGAGDTITGIILTGGPVSTAGIVGTIGQAIMLTGDIARGLNAIMALAADQIVGMLVLPITVTAVAASVQPVAAAIASQHEVTTRVTVQTV